MGTVERQTMNLHEPYSNLSGANLSPRQPFYPKVVIFAGQVGAPPRFQGSLSCDCVRKLRTSFFASVKEKLPKAIFIHDLRGVDVPSRAIPIIAAVSCPCPAPSQWT